MGLLNAITGFNGNGLLGTVINGIEKVADGIQNLTESDFQNQDGTEKTKDDINSLKKIAKEMGNIIMVCLLDKEDKFVKEEEKKAKEKEEKANEKEINKAYIEQEYNAFQNNGAFSSENIINNMTETNIISDSKISGFIQLVENLLNDTKDNTTLSEGIKIFTSKLNEMEAAAQKYISDLLDTKDEEDAFAIDTARDKQDAKNKIKTEDSKTTRMNITA